MESLENELTQLRKVVNTVPETIVIKGVGLGRVVELDGVILSPEESQAVYNHSPDGFNWGYEGSGPSQLALAVMLKYLPKHLAELVYYTFKIHFISRVHDNFVATIKFRAWLEKVIERPIKPEELLGLINVEELKLEDSGLNVIDSLSFVKKPEEDKAIPTGSVVSRRYDNPLMQ